MKTTIVASFAMLLWSVAALAHFQTIIPSSDIIGPDDGKEIVLDVRFMHPFEGHIMNMDRPARFGVVARGQESDLVGHLAPAVMEGMNVYKAVFQVKRPGDHIFFIEPSPYWEPAEDKYIIHYTKVVVGALGLEEGWDRPVGLKTEIVPLTRPYGLWTGNVFRGVVYVDGKPAPGVEIEVEYLNDGGVVKAPSDPFVCQVVKADANGVFEYAMPRAGWWGFAALSEDDRTLPGPDGEKKEIEIGAVMWVKTVDMK